MTDRRDALGRSPVDFVLEYLTERRAWEIEAAGLDRQGQDDAVIAGYDRLMSRFVISTLISQGLGPNFADPTDLDPTRTTILRTTTRGDTAVVTTQEDIREFVEGEFEYRLRLIDGEWRLEDRRTRDFDGSWIKYVL